MEAIWNEYTSDPKNRDIFKTVEGRLIYRIKAKPEWGIEKDILFGHETGDGGELKWVGLISEEEAEKTATWICGTSPETWKKILRKEEKFIADVATGKVKQEFGDKVSFVGLTKVADPFVNLLARAAELKFPDEMSADELAKYKAYVKAFRQKLGV